MELTKYIPAQVTTVEEMNPQKSIREILSNSIDKKSDFKAITATIILIASKYLSLNVKGKGITNEAGFSLLSEFIITECGNLELQEIEYIFKKGVLGRFGEIYNDISIDTICGKNGWIETYYKTDRKDKNETVNLETKERFSGNEMSVEEFYKRNHEAAKRAMIKDIVEKAKTRRAKMPELKQFYKLKDLTLNDLKDDLEALSKQYYQLSENERAAIKYEQYESIWLNDFIINNQYKVKS